MEHCLGPRAGLPRGILQLENQPVRPRPKKRSTIKVAASVENDACGGVGAILAVESVNPCLLPLATCPAWWGELEDYAAASSARPTFAPPRLVVSAEVCCAVDRILVVENQPAVGI